MSTRECDPGICSTRRPIGGTRGSTVSARHEFDDRKAETRAAATAGLVGAAEAVEGAGAEVVGKAGTSVADVKLDEAVPFLCGKLDSAIAVRQSVVDEVHERLPDAKRISFDVQSGVVNAQLPAERTRATREPGFRVGEQVSGGDDLEPDRQRTPVGPGDEEQVVGEP